MDESRVKYCAVFSSGRFLVLLFPARSVGLLSRRRTLGSREGIVSGATLRPAQSINDQHLALASCHPVKGNPRPALSTYFVRIFRLVSHRIRYFFGSINASICTIKLKWNCTFLKLYFSLYINVTFKTWETNLTTNLTIWTIKFP